LAKLALLDAGFQCSVEENIEHLVRGGDVVVGLDVFLECNTATIQKRWSATNFHGAGASRKQKMTRPKWVPGLLTCCPAYL
jgi:hypothetical protein